MSTRPHACPPARAVAALSLAAACGAALLVTAPSASAATTVAAWRMNDTGGTTMRDVTGRHAGTVGSDVVRNGSTYRFPFFKPGSGYRPQHIVRVPDSDALDPGTRDWAVTVRFRYTNSFGNMMQKGQGGPGATYFKMEGTKGIVSCLFRGTEGNVSVNSGRTLNDGRWHVVRCRRAGSTVSMTVDGAVRSNTGATGAISNGYGFTIGGKGNCDAVKVSCDYWTGEMDQVRITRG